MRFKSKVAIVTGGSSGIGKETAKRLVAEGASVVLSGKDDAKLQSAAREIGGSAGQVRVLAGDITKPATGAALVERAEQDFGGLDILVSNAGVFKPKPFNEITEEEYDWFLDTILKGKFFIAQAAAKAMKKRGGGAIVHTGSMWALQAIGATPSSAYSAANAGVHALISHWSWQPTKSGSMPSLLLSSKLPSTRPFLARSRCLRFCPPSTLFIL